MFRFRDIQVSVLNHPMFYQIYDVMMGISA